MKAAQASACTDITGFGLFGHLMRMARQSKLTAEVFADALPAFDGALEAFRDGVIPGAVERNREFLGDGLQVAPDVDEALVHLGCDAQTSGGLLIAVTPDRLEKLKQALAQLEVKCFIIGRFVGPSNGRILVTNSAPQTRPTRCGRGRPRPFHHEFIITFRPTRTRLLRRHLRGEARPREFRSRNAESLRRPDALGAGRRRAERESQGTDPLQPGPAQPVPPVLRRALSKGARAGHHAGGAGRSGLVRHRDGRRPRAHVLPGVPATRARARPTASRNSPTR